MLHQVLHDYLSEQCQSVADAIPALTATSNEKAIHTLRVSVKKIRALFTLVAHLPGYSFELKKTLKTLKLLQDAAGHLRDLQLQSSLLKGYEQQFKTGYPLLRLLLRNNQALATAQLQETVARIPAKLPEQLPEKLQLNKQHHKHTKATAEMVAYLQQQYEDLIVPPRNAPHEAWHSLRKKAKRLHFQLHILHTHLPDKINEAALHALTKKMGELLGKWHDHHELLLFIKHSIQLARKEKIAISTATTGLVKQVAADCRKYLDGCTALMQKVPAFYITAARVKRL